MGLWKSIGGMLELEITSAEPEKTLDEITARGVTVYSARQVSYLTYRIRVCRSDYAWRGSGTDGNPFLRIQ